MKESDIMKKSIAIIVSTPLTINSFMLDHIRELTKLYDVTVIANKKLGVLSETIDVRFINLQMNRDVSILNDLYCVLKLCRIINNKKFDVVHTITPKAAFIGMLASSICQVQHRFHTFTGQVWITRKGLFRKLLKSIDKLIFKLSSFALVDSPSQRQFLMDEKVITDSGSSVLGIGSISGVNVDKFKYFYGDFIQTREQYNIPKDAFVYLFLGRLCKDKGIDELIESFQSISGNGSQSYLLLVGPNESDYGNEFFNKLDNKNIIPVGLTTKPEVFFNASNVLVLPSYREGFGTTVLEAAACGIPTIASDIYGLSDAVVHNKTGLLHTVRDINSLTACMRKFESNPDVCKKMGILAKERVYNEFTSNYLADELLHFYKERVGV
ncbi:glycosyltransferase [Vibrio splendidus]